MRSCLTIVARPRIRDFDRLVEKELEDGGDLPTMMLEETVGRLQRDLEELQVENQFLKTRGQSDLYP